VGPQCVEMTELRLGSLCNALLALFTCSQLSKVYNARYLINFTVLGDMFTLATGLS